MIMGRNIKWVNQTNPLITFPLDCGQKSWGCDGFSLLGYRLCVMVTVLGAVAVMASISRGKPKEHFHHTTLRLDPHNAPFCSLQGYRLCEMVTVLGAVAVMATISRGKPKENFHHTTLQLDPHNAPEFLSSLQELGN